MPIHPLLVELTSVELICHFTGAQGSVLTSSDSNWNSGQQD